MESEVDVKLSGLKKDFNYLETLGYVIVFKQFIRKKTNTSIYKEIRAEWFDFDGDEWLLIRLPKESKYQRIKLVNVKPECKLIKTKGGRNYEY